MVDGVLMSKGITMERAIRSILQATDGVEVVVSVRFNPNDSLLARISVDPAILSSDIYMGMLMEYLGILIYQEFDSHLTRWQEKVDFFVGDVVTSIDLKLPSSTEEGCLATVHSFTDDEITGLFLNDRLPGSVLPPACREFATVCIAIGIIDALKSRGTPGYVIGDPVYISA